MIITLESLPADLQRHIGTFLQYPFFSRRDDIDQITLAAILNDHEILDYYLCKGKYSRYDISRRVTLSGSIRTFVWMVKKGLYPMEKQTGFFAVESGNLQLLQWLHSAGCPWDEYTCTAAAMKGNLEMLQWLHSTGCPWDERTCGAAAAESGNLEMLQWLHSAGCLWNEETCKAAAWKGNLEMLQWLRSAGCPWDESICLAAAKSGNLEILQWAIDHGCPEPMNNRTYDAVKACLLEML
jgi:hypothetical protein